MEPPKSHVDSPDSHLDSRKLSLESLVSRSARGTCQLRGCRASIAQRQKVQTPRPVLTHLRSILVLQLLLFACDQCLLACAEHLWRGALCVCRARSQGAVCLKSKNFRKTETSKLRFSIFPKIAKRETQLPFFNESAPMFLPRPTLDNCSLALRTLEQSAAVALQRQNFCRMAPCVFRAPSQGAVCF